MKRGRLLKIDLTVPLEAADAAAELLRRVLGESPVIYRDAKTRRTSAFVYVQDPSRWTNEARARLRAGLSRIRDSGLSRTRPRVVVSRIRQEDWAESWKRHFKPIEITSALLVKPTWSRRRPHRGQTVLLLDPGLSFGTGQHPTTRFCLEQIAVRRRQGLPQSMLDIGTGSGILAIAAAKLGYHPVAAFDSDPDAVRVARANARLNRVGNRVRLACRDLTGLSRSSVQKYDLVCANLTADLLLSEHARIAKLVWPGGTLVLAGVLVTQFRAIAAACAKAGWRLDVSRQEMEWKSGAFVEQ